MSNQPEENYLKVDTFIAPTCHAEIEIIFRDEHLLIINKPSGLLTLSGKNPLNKDSVHFRILKDFPTAAIIHRLDFGTSGLLIISLNKKTTQLLNQQFSKREITKKYDAILYGLVKNDSGLIDLAIAKDSINFPVVKVCEETGKPAITNYQVVERDFQKNTTRVIFTPHTGRTHQLRVHSKALGHCILGDNIYAHSDAFEMSPRLMLHARELIFTHPHSLKRMHMIKNLI